MTNTVIPTETARFDIAAEVTIRAAVFWNVQIVAQVVRPLNIYHFTAVKCKKLDASPRETIRDFHQLQHANSGLPHQIFFQFFHLNLLSG